ncbi:threonine-rich protein-like [Amphibalanus amphitrite]|uniref:threonine-rich protein-like n=1 Tax=Amphibalanus amphitrite TaxID=1232801 RepID=UPI001C90F4EA|nr:threonine-rich protein-like [Amphibalanus amphitrite]
MMRVCAALSVALLAVVPSLLVAAPVSDCPRNSDPDQPVFVASDQSCSQFYLCSNGRPILLTCPDGLYFNEDTDQCDYRFNVNCTEPATTTTEVPTTEGPLPTTKEPVSTTEGPVPTNGTTKAHVPTTEAPVPTNFTTEGHVSTTEAPVPTNVTTEAPVPTNVTTAVPISTTDNTATTQF